MATTHHSTEMDLQQPPVRGNSEDLLVVLVHELLEAHDDTVSLAAELAHDARWQAHVNYLRGLKLVSRSILAETSEVSLL